MIEQGKKTLPDINNTLNESIESNTTKYWLKDEWSERDEVIYKHIREPLANEGNKNGERVCNTEFLYGKNSCNKKCKAYHKLNFNKIWRGICFNDYFEQGSCKWGKKCMFTHEIPDKQRKDGQMIEGKNTIRGKAECEQRDWQ